MVKVIQLSPQKLSPKEYIKTKVRSLPIEKCLINKDWRQSDLANIFVIRKHTNGNATIGLYLIDLLCLGVKNAAYFFNLSPLEVAELIERSSHLENIEIDYNLAHNIIYAGHDFAMEFEIEPHRDFEVAKYILQEDNDDIPLIEVAVGNQDGLPFLLVRNKNQFRDALDKLKKNAGEGNYKYFVDNGIETDDDDDDDNEFDENDHFANGSLSDYENGMLLPYEATQINWRDTENFTLLNERNELDQITCSLALNRIAYQEIFPENSITVAYMREEEWIDIATENFEERNFDKEVKESETLLTQSGDVEDTEMFEAMVIKALQKSDSVYTHILAYELSFITNNISFQKNIKDLIEKKFTINFSLQTIFALVALVNENTEEEFVKLLSTSDDFFELFPNAGSEVLPRDLLNFWLFKIVQSCNEKDLEKAMFYYDGIIHTFETSPLLNTVQIKLLELATSVIENNEN